MDLAHQKEEEKTKAMDKEEGMTEKHKKKVKLHHLRTPYRGRNIKEKEGSPEKPSARKKTCTSKPKMKATLTEDDIDLIITVMEDASEDILQ
jgi:hypothetical protein